MPIDPSALYARGLISDGAMQRLTPASGDFPPGKTPPSKFLDYERRPPDLMGGAPRATVRNNGPKIKFSDDGEVVHAQPENMQVPEWGKNLSWGMKAFRTDRGDQKILQVRDARLPPDMQGQGAGQKMYESMADLAAKEGRALHSDGSVTEAAANRWMALNRSGRNVAMNPDAKYRPGPPEAPNLGRFETSDGSPVFRIDPESQ